jgi:cation diffusion facilitator family transporter
MSQIESKEKRNVALSSIIAAIFLTGGKLTVGLMTGSLGILSEALHSGLDMIAAIMTFFAVKYADRPPDSDHNYGHGKIENLSALFETFILTITCVWIAWEAIDRLTTGKTDIMLSFWSFAVIIVSVGIDYGRSRALYKTAKKYNSQALEADAIHFSTDIFSSLVVLAGLVGAYFNYHFLDSLAALVVSVIVFTITLRLGKRSIDVLLDRSPGNLQDKVMEISREMPEIAAVHGIRIRASGSTTFIDLNMHVDPGMTIGEAHDISTMLENRIQEAVKKSEVHVHIEPHSIEEINQLQQ